MGTQSGTLLFRLALSLVFSFHVSRVSRAPSRFLTTLLTFTAQIRSDQVARHKLKAHVRIILFLVFFWLIYLQYIAYRVYTIYEANDWFVVDACDIVSV